jgi:hypothetical protein
MSVKLIQFGMRRSRTSTITAQISSTTNGA